MGRKEGYADPVAIASFSMDPVIITWLNGYAQQHQTTKSWIVRKALIDFKEKYDPKVTTGLVEGFWQCSACELPTANQDADAFCWRCKGAKQEVLQTTTPPWVSE